MLQARTTRGRAAVNNENDENTQPRVTRAKAAGLTVPSDGALAAKKPLQAKKGTLTNSKQSDVPGRKRAALGDVSNVRNPDDRPAEGKKPAAGKASAGIPKPTRTNSTRNTVKDGSSSNELKRPASVASIANNKPAKRRQPSNAARPWSIKASDEDEENIPPAVDADNKGRTEVVETIVKRTTKPDGTVVEQEVKRHSQTFEAEADDKPLPAMSEALMAQIASMDEEDVSDPLMVAEYAYEIFDYMKELELKTMPNPEYMEHQPKLEWRMRGVLVDWLLEVHQRFHLLPETFYLTVSIIDRFLTHKVVELERLQLVGVTAMFIASKYEEVLSPHIQNFVHVADDGFSEAEILSAERYVLSVLEYDLSFPNPMHFMRRISKADNYDIQTRTFAKYLLEISLLDHRLLQFRPSINAAAAMHLARTVLDRNREWEDVFVHYSGYTEEEIMPAFDIMLDYLRQPVQHNAFYKKYAGKKFMKGESLCFGFFCDLALIHPTASLFCRQWAKTYASEYLEGSETVQ